MAVEHINETDTLNQGRIKINAILDQSNASSEKVDGYKAELAKGVDEAKQIATTAGEEAKQIATAAGEEANEKADKAISDSKTAIQTANQAVGTANQNKQDFDALRNEFDDLVAESGDSNPEIVQARTDTEGIKQSTLQARLTRDFSNRMTTSEAIKMFSGAVNTPQMMEFNGKSAGNISTNPHQAFSDYTATTLKKPSAAWNEVSQDNYNKLAGRDDSGISTGSTQNGVIPQQLYKMNVIEAVKSLAPNILDGKTLEESIKYVKDNFISFTLSIRGKASSPNNNNLKVATYLESTDSYTTQLQNAAKEYTDLTVEIIDSNFLDSAGIINVLVYSDSSNGVTSSNIDIDYFGVQIVISMDALKVLESSGFITDDTLEKHINDNTNPHKVTKSQVGLGNVENYATATQADAEVGTANNLFMTPLRVFQAITKWVDGKFISKTGTETVSGIKNFQDGLQSAGKEVSTIDQLNLYGIYGEGANQSKFPVGSKIPMGELVATDFAHTESDLPYTISSNRITLTATRDCVLFFEGTVKIHGDNTLKYAYVKIRKNGSDTNFASLGSGVNFNYMTIQHGQQVHTLKKGDKVEFTLEAASGGVLFATQFVSMKITEVKPL
ncbi:hypothetical protein UA3_01138 [Enterococcus faecium EnGen0263]|uniref:hypothetical protein n=1 Tax=Enterococcus faecium TaxID=1352 RepID=UPI00032F9497|nr:hypothetical protein [Enterococcus faecium]EOH55955.1 hypothetical protein UA3_01138 [Enterococcus faecium EnGen0263]